MSFVTVTMTLPQVPGTLPASCGAPSWGWGPGSGSCSSSARASCAADAHVFSTWVYLRKHRSGPLSLRVTPL